MILCAALFACLIQASESAEPIYEGKKLSAWLVEAYNPGDQQEHAREAIRQMGTNALPMLIKVLQTPDRNQAVSAFRVLGATATSAVPAVLNLLTNDIIAQEAVYALVQIGPQASLSISYGLTNQNSKIRLGSAMAFSLMASEGKLAKSAVPLLLNAIHDHDTNVCSYASHALRRIDPEAADKAGVKQLLER